MDTLRVIFDSENASDFIDSLAVNNSVSRSQARLIDEFANQKASATNSGARSDAVAKLVADLKKQADENEKAAKNAQKAAQNAKAEMEGLLKKQKASQAEFKAKESEIKAQKEATQAAHDDLVKKLASMTPPSPPPSPDNGGGSDGQIIPGGGGTFIYPLAEPFINYNNYGISTWGNLPHTGDDFAASCGTPIFAAAAGYVTHAAANWFEGGNQQVVINHGNIGGNLYTTTYNHLSAFATSQGLYVNQGQIVGYVGTTGWSTGCHLHFEVLINGSYVDPMSVL
jgi:murein DD-endopeptidase MepM/ murein hydrolase activator NlpD